MIYTLTLTGDQWSRSFSSLNLVIYHCWYNLHHPLIMEWTNIIGKRVITILSFFFHLAFHFDETLINKLCFNKRNNRSCCLSGLRDDAMPLSNKKIMGLLLLFFILFNDDCKKLEFLKSSVTQWLRLNLLCFLTSNAVPPSSGCETISKEGLILK